MYTEYVYDDKRYDVASREIKATLFDIIATEEAKIAQLREKAFVDTVDPREAAELQSLYVQQDTCLREILAISEKLSKSLQRVDACSRKLKQIEDKNIAQIIANIKEVDGAQSAMNMQPEWNGMVGTPEINEPVMVSSQDMDVNSYTGAADVAMAPEPVDEPVMENSVGDVTPIEDVSMNSPEGEVVTDTEPKEEVIHEFIETPEENVSTEEPVDSSAETVSIPSIVSTSEVSAEGETSNNELMDANTTVTSTEGEVNASSDSVTIPVITVSSDGPLEAVTGSSGVVENSQGDVLDNQTTIIPDMVPEDSGEMSQVTATTVTVTPSNIVLHKRTNDTPKVIMISGKQAIKLRESLPTQEAFLSSKGYFQESGLEQNLVNNELPSPDVAGKQAQIEQMMNKANELYAAGQVEEAQNMYNQISILNNELQLESAGSVK